MYKSHTIHVQTLFAIAICGLGCSGDPGRIAPPAVNAEQAAAQAMQLYDRDGDASLSVLELKDSPSLQAASSAYDADHDGSLSEIEIAAGIARWSVARKGAFSLPFQVLLDGRPFEGAAVKLLPEKFLGDAMPPAEGTADANGTGYLNLASEYRPANAPNIPLVPPGLFSVEISHPTIKLPIRYSTQTTLGIETSIAAQNPAGVVWLLRSLE